MGTKQAWNGKYVLLYLTSIITIFSGIQGCTNFEKKQLDKQDIAKTDVLAGTGDNKGTLEDIIEVLNLFPDFAKKWQGKQDLTIARTFMFKGDYNASILYNKKVLSQFSQSLGDQALFQMGLTYVHPENPKPDNKKSLKCFQRIIEEFPKSRIREEAGIWILVLEKFIKSDKRFDNQLHQIESLKNQIKKLKEIDLGIEDKKRIDLPEERGDVQ